MNSVHLIGRLATDVDRTAEEAALHFWSTESGSAGAVAGLPRSSRDLQNVLTL
jgi:hypothetical protein